MKSLQDLKTGCVKMRSYKLTPDAEDDLWRIYQWGFSKHGEVAADKYYNTFFDHFEILAESPLLYPAVEYIHKGYRKSVCGVDTVYYRIVGDNIEIMNILGQQDRDKWL